MPSRQVVFSLFRYPPRHALAAFILMGFQGLARDRLLPAGKVKLLGCGSRDGFSILPDFNRYCLASMLDQPQQLAALRHSRFYRLIAGPSREQLHFVLEPASGHGTWEGDPPFHYSGQALAGQPFAVLTWAKVAPRQARRFWQSVPDIRRSLRDASGCLYHIGFGEHPLLTLATFSIWRDLDAMRDFAYRHTPHQRTQRQARQDGWLTESLFVRFAISRVAGDLQAYPRLQQALAATQLAAAGDWLTANRRDPQ